MSDGSHPPPNTLGKASLVLGVLSVCFVFCTGLCAGVGQQQGWLAHLGVLLFVFGATFAFVGLVGAFVGFVGVFIRPRATAVVGLGLGVAAVVLFAAVLNAVKP